MVKELNSYDKPFSNKLEIIFFPFNFLISSSKSLFLSKKLRSTSWTNSKNSSDFFSLYDYLDEYNKPGNCDTDSSGRISNHRLVKYHLEKLNLLEKLKFEFHMFDDFPEVRRKYFGCRK